MNYALLQIGEETRIFPRSSQDDPALRISLFHFIIAICPRMTDKVFCSWQNGRRRAVIKRRHSIGTNSSQQYGFLANLGSVILLLFLNKDEPEHCDATRQNPMGRSQCFICLSLTS